MMTPGLALTYDKERLRRMTSLMEAACLDALVCRIPRHVLMLSGRHTLSERCVSILRRDGIGVLIVPEHEPSPSGSEHPHDIRRFAATDGSTGPLSLVVQACDDLEIADARIGVEADSPFAEADGDAIHPVWLRALPCADLIVADSLLRRAAAVKSSHEIERIRIACKLAEKGMLSGRGAILAGTREVEVAAQAVWAMETEGVGWANVKTVTAAASCVSGPRSSESAGPLRYSTNRRLQTGDAVVLEAQCAADGYWSSVVRTFFVDAPTPTMASAYSAILDAWESALDGIGPVVPVCTIVSRSQAAVEDGCFRAAAQHRLGGGIGFTPGDPLEPPEIRADSEAVLEPDMVFTLEPTACAEHEWGIRIRDVVCVRGNRAKVLSDMRRDPDWSVCR